MIRAWRENLLLGLQRWAELRWTPVRVFQPVCCRGAAQQARTDLRPQVIRNAQALRVCDCRGPEPASHPTNLHHVWHEQV